MSRTDLWTSAAEAMREDADIRWHAVADWLRSEAACQDELEPFADLVNVAIEQASGVKGYLRFIRKPDGDLSLIVDTNEGATAVALAYLEPTSHHPRTDETTESEGNR